jgi:3'(2'), 5'-bisphosphate nucleotidase
MQKFSAIVEAVEQAALLCQTVQDKFLKSTDKHGEPVTIADYGSQALICRAIAQNFPDDGVLAEESGKEFMELIDDGQRQIIAEVISEILSETVTPQMVREWLDFGHGRTARYTWVIDPIDGTKGFINFRRYTIAVGYLDHGQPVAGIMGCPGYPHRDNMEMTGYIFYNETGQTYVKKLRTAHSEATRVSANTLSDEIRILESYEREHVDHDLMGKVYEEAGIAHPAIVGVDGQDKYGMLAFGDGELYLRIPPKKGYRQKVWDHAAGVAVLQGAGGTVTDIDGSPLDFSLGRKLENNKMIVATNGIIHESILAALRSAVDVDNL